MENVKDYIIRFMAGEEIKLQLVKDFDGIERYETFYSVIEDSERRVRLRITVERSLLSTTEKLFLRIYG